MNTITREEAASLIWIFLQWFDRESLSEYEEVQLHQQTYNKLCRIAGEQPVDLNRRNLDNFEQGR